MSKRFIVTEEEKRSILSKYKINEQKSLSVKDLDGDYEAKLNNKNELVVTTEDNYSVNLGTVKNFSEKGTVTISVTKQGGKTIVKYKGKVLKTI